MNTEPITTGAELEALRAEWTALCAEAEATPFQTPEWLVPWWEHVAEGELLTIAAREEGRLVGLVPLYVWTRPDDGLRHLFLLGVSTTDELDGVFLPGFERRAAEAVFARLDTLRDRWDVAELTQLGSRSALLVAETPSRWTARVGAGESCYGMALSGPEPDLPARIQKNLRYYRNKAALGGSLRSERADERTLGAASEVLFALHRRRWGARGLSDGVEDSHRAALPTLLRRGSVRLDVTWLDDRPIGAMYALTDHRSHRLYLMAYERAFEDLSPGTLVIGHAIEQAAADGVPAVDFLRGEEPYKRLWGVVERPMYRRRMAPGSG